jgi:pyruvate-formate lyase
MLLQVPKEWRSFSSTAWRSQIDVRDVIVSNVTPCSGGSEFLAPPARTSVTR